MNQNVNPKVARMLQVARDIENSRKNIQRAKDCQRLDKDIKGRAMGEMLRAKNAISEETILRAAECIKAERRHVEVEAENERRIAVRMRELLEMAGSNPFDDETGPTFADVEDLAGELSAVENKES